MATQEDRNEKVAEQLAAANSKGQLIEKLVFAGLPIMFSCIVYLMSALSNANNEVINLKNKVAVVVNNDNKAIPPQGTTIDMAQIREVLSDKIDKVEKDAALARAAMTLDREKQLGMLEKQRMEMNAESATARANIKSEGALALQQVKEVINTRIDALDRASSLSRAELDKRITLLEKSSK
jgi:hypothetical protein